PRRQDAAGRVMTAGEGVLDRRLAVERVRDRLAHEGAGQAARPRVEPVEADAEGRPPHVLVARVGALAPAERRHRALLEIAVLELLAHGVVRLAGEDPVHDARQARRALERVGVPGEHDLLPALPADEPERPGPDRRGAERVALLLG